MSALWDRLPLPAEHAVPMLGGLVLQRFTTRTSRTPLGLTKVGWAVMAAGVSLNVWAVQSRGAGDLERPDRLVTAGPYGVSRNPMYVGWSLLHLGAGIAVRSPWVLASWPIAFAMVHRAVLGEERQLAAQFGNQLSEYAEHVPRYLPAWRSIRAVNL